MSRWKWRRVCRSCSTNGRNRSTFLGRPMRRSTRSRWSSTCSTAASAAIRRTLSSETFAYGESRLSMSIGCGTPWRRWATARGRRAWTCQGSGCTRLRRRRTMAMHNPPHPGGIVKRQCLEPLGLTVTLGCPGAGRHQAGAVRVVERTDGDLGGDGDPAIESLRLDAGGVAGDADGLRSVAGARPGRGDCGGTLCGGLIGCPSSAATNCAP